MSKQVRHPADCGGRLDTDQETRESLIARAFTANDANKLLAFADRLRGVNSCEHIWTFHTPSGDPSCQKCGKRWTSCYA